MWYIATIPPFAYKFGVIRMIKLSIHNIYLITFYFKVRIIIYSLNIYSSLLEEYVNGKPMTLHNVKVNVTIKLGIWFD